MPSESGHPAPPGCKPQRFPDAPRRTRRAPFVTHRALPRCLRIVRTRIRPLLITHDTDGGQSYGNRITVAPAQRLLARLVPARLSRKFIHPGIGVLLVEPAFDGPPDIVVYPGEHTFRAPRMSIEVTPATQDRIHPLQSALQGLGDRAPIEDQFDAP